MQTSPSQNSVFENLSRLQALQATQSRDSDLMNQLLPLDMNTGYTRVSDPQNVTTFGDVLNRTLSTPRREEASPESEAEAPPSSLETGDKSAHWGDAPTSDRHRNSTRPWSTPEQSHVDKTKASPRTPRESTETAPATKNNETPHHEAPKAVGEPKEVAPATPTTETTATIIETIETKNTNAVAATVTMGTTTTQVLETTTVQVSDPAAQVSAGALVSLDSSPTPPAEQAPTPTTPDTAQSPNQTAALLVTSGSITATKNQDSGTIALSVATPSIAVTAKVATDTSGPPAHQATTPLAQTVQTTNVETMTVQKEPATGTIPAPGLPGQTSGPAAAVTAPATLVQNIQNQAVARIPVSAPVAAPPAPQVNPPDLAQTTANTQPVAQIAQALGAAAQAKAGATTDKIGLTEAVAAQPISSIGTGSQTTPTLPDLSTLNTGLEVPNPAATTGKAATVAATPTPLPTLLGQVTENMQVAVRENQRELVVQLNPAELGRITIRFTQDEDGLVGMIRVSERQTHRDLEQLLPQILQNLENSGTTVRRIDVQLQNDPNANQSQTDAQGREPNNSQAQQREHQPHNPETDAPAAPAAQTSTDTDTQPTVAPGRVDMLL